MDELAKARALLTEVEQFGEANPGLRRVCHKLSRKVRADASFLEKHKDQISNSKNGQSSVSSSNIPYLTGVLHVVKQSENVQEVICDFRKYGITVDVVCDKGNTWKKVVARNPQSLHLIWAGKGQYGTKDVVRKAEKYIVSARKFCEFSPPKIVCVFCNGVTYDMAAVLESKGIRVEGERVAVSQEVLDRLHAIYNDDSDSSEEDLFEQARRALKNPVELECVTPTDSADLCQQVKQMPTQSKVFLDITTMLVYVSDVCNGGECFEFKEKVLAEQAAQERERSALDSILPHLNVKVLVTCQSALDDYKDIVKTLGGPEENKRAQELIKRLIVVPDRVSARFSELAVSGQIRERSKIIFGTADMLRCNILTSNEGFVRAAAGQGVHIPALLHDPRALSEQKRLSFTN